MAEKSIAKLIIETAVNDKGYKKGIKDLYEDVTKDDKKLSNRKGLDYDKALNKALSLGKGLTSVLNNVAKGFFNITGTIGLLGGALGGLGAIGVILDKAFDRAFGSSEQFKANLQYIGFVASKMIENFLNPAIEKTREIIEKIVNGLVKIIQYVGYILSAISGRNVFEGTGVNDFKKSLDKTDKSAKQLKKDLMGFDEVNKLSDNGSTDSFVAPSFEIKGLDENEVPGWLKWIVDNGPLVKEILLGIAGGIIAVKLGMDGLQGIGIGLMIIGIIQGLKDIKDLLEDPTWQKFGKVVSDLGLVVFGFGLVIGSLPVILAGAILVMDGLIIQFSEEIVGKIQEIRGKLREFMDKVYEKTNWLVGWLVEILTLPFRQLMSQFEGLLTGAKQIVEGIIKLFKGDFADGLTLIFVGVMNMIAGVVNSMIDAINTILVPIRKLIVEGGKIAGKNWTMSDITIPHVPLTKLAKGGILNNPGQGVNMGNVIGGEKGPEAYLPLNDSTLDGLGRAIARHIEVNLTNINQMNGRTLSREMKKIVNDLEFGGNR